MQSNYYSVFVSRYRNLVLLSLFVVFVFLGYKVDLERLCIKLKLTQQKTKVLFLEIEHKCRLVQSKAENNAQVNEQANKYEIYRYKFIKKFEFAELLQNIAALAKNNNLQILEIKPGATQVSGGFEIYAVSFLIKGSFYDLFLLVAQLSQLEYFVALPTYKMYVSENALNLEATIFAYNYRGGVELHAGTNKSISTKKIVKMPIGDPFINSNESFLQNKPDITKWESKNLNIVGMIKENGKNTAIISDPMEFVYHINIGEKIWLKKVRVLKITDSAVITRDASQNIYWQSGLKK